MNDTVLGHCGSIAVYPQHRGKGIAQVLMTQLHFNLAEYYRMDKISLLCRPSNAAAFKLYSKEFQYQTVKEEKNYYPDGESALYMVRSGLMEWRKAVGSAKGNAITKAIDLRN